MLRRTASIGATVTALTLMIVAGATSAAADPSFTPDAGDIVGVGDSTSQGLVTALATGYNSAVPAPTDLVASFDGTGSASIMPREGCAQIPRPRTSTQGIRALVSDTAGCVDFARSSREPIAGEDTLAFLPYAYDGVSWLVANRSNAPESLSSSELAAIFTCTARRWTAVGGTSTELIRPVLPPRGSDTRAFFLRAIGVRQPGSCVTTGTAESQLAMDGGSRLRNLIAPFSIPAYIQGGPVGTYEGKRARLGSVDGEEGEAVSPFVVGPAGEQIFNTAFPEGFVRPLYVVVERDELGAVPARLNGVFGFSGYVCSDAGQQVVVQQGFGSLPQANGCGIG